MKNIIIGTAGHVDHGKTCLIKALTGTDTDRLKEEKKRGITIELGFATLLNESDLHIGIIDVPGHEKFVKNMLAGIGGIDFVLLVIAIDEGVMPQTVEHFNILKMINIKKGIIVYTKCDVATDDIFEIVDSDVTNLVKGSFLENASRIKVSSFTGENIDKLKNMILEEAKNIKDRRDEKELMRLPIDRVFSMEGFGTVITGTLIEGSVNVLDELELYPKGKYVKVRQIESHNEKVDSAKSGQRTAINLSNISKDEIDRGDVLAYKNSMFLSNIIDCKVKLFSDAIKTLKTGDSMHINYGSNQTECKVFLIGKQLIDKNEECFAQIRFNEQVAVKKNDKFILRCSSPNVTIGGGIILDSLAIKHKMNDLSIIPYLEALDKNDDMLSAKMIIDNYSKDVVDNVFISKKLNLDFSTTNKILNDLLSKKEILKVGNDRYISNEFFNTLVVYIKDLLGIFHKENPILNGMNKEEFKGKIQKNFHIELDDNLEKLVNLLIDKNVIKFNNGLISNLDFSAGYNNANSKILDQIEKTYFDAKIEVPTVTDVVNKFDNKKLARQIINDLAKNHKLIKIDNEIYYHIDNFNFALNKMYEYFDNNKEISLADFRNLLNTSRKYSLFILDACDRLKITKKIGDTRILIKKMNL